MQKLKLIYSSAIASQVAVVFAVIITICAEMNSGLKDWLKSVTGHHWSTKSYLTMLFYSLVFSYAYMVFKNINGGKVKRAMYNLGWLAVAGAVVLVGFFFWHSQ